MNERPKTREQQLERYAKKCIHFNGVQNKLCEAGVDYGTHPRRSDQGFVCFGEVLGCPKFEAIGLDRARKYFEESDRDVGNYIKARTAIKEHTKGARGIQGTISCPICKVGIIHYSIAGSNGHCHARCSTKDCVAWME